MIRADIAAPDKEGLDSYDSNTNKLTLTREDLYKFGYSVFEDMTSLERWMHKKNGALAHRRPIDLLNTPAGIEEVQNILGRIAHGVYS
jgi:putative toxin-antitoxin system antitoxin component (TIGR02293 family)